jgi:16S rRNA (cytosine967-C5)-methyltransferase
VSVSPARRAAFEVLLRVFEDDAYADRAFRTAATSLDERDRALAQRLAYGAVQRVRTLDHAIGMLGRRPVRKLDPPVRAALRLAAYQLAYTGVAAHAAANESVELVRAARLERAVPFTNAVCRRLAEGIQALLDALPEGPLKHSYPDWIWDVWRRDFGAEAALELMRAQNEPPEIVVRLVRGEPTGEPTDVPGAYRVERIAEQALAEGRVWPQSRGSQLAGLVVGSRPGERVLDLCSAPGGKAAMLAGEVTAVELDEGRSRELRENLARLRADNVHVLQADGLALPSDVLGFDRALVDAAERVRPGGTVVYAVCTLNVEENEAVVDASGLHPIPLGDEWPAFRHPGRPEFLLTLPHVHGTAGFFIARLLVPEPRRRSTP